jgi:hypothetical protein
LYSTLVVSSVSLLIAGIIHSIPNSAVNIAQLILPVWCRTQFTRPAACDNKNAGITNACVLNMLVSLNCSIQGSSKCPCVSSPRHCDVRPSSQCLASFTHVRFTLKERTNGTAWISHRSCLNAWQSRVLWRLRSSGDVRLCSWVYPDFERTQFTTKGNTKTSVISQDTRILNKITVEASNFIRVTSAHLRNQTSILQLFQPIAWPLYWIAPDHNKS